MTRTTLFVRRPVALAALAVSTALSALGAACAPAARRGTEPAAVPAPARHSAPRAQAAQGATQGVTQAAAGGEVVPVALLGGAGAGGARAARWAGTYAPGAERARALVLRLRDGGAGALAGELTLLVPPRASTFAGGAAAPVRVTVPVARGRYAGGRLVLDTEAYYDAACECTVTGTFRAAVRGDTLAGTYATRGPATAAATRGRWRAVRAAER